MKNIKKVKVCIMMLCILLLVGISGCGKEEESSQELETVLGDLQQEFDEVKKEGVKAEVSEYITPDETEFLWVEVEDGVAIEGYKGTATAINIPAQLGGKDVVEIKEGAFDEVVSVLEGIKFPDTLLRINEKAFLYYMALKEVDLGKGVSVLGDHAFEGCMVLTNIIGGDSLERTGFNCFSNCQSLKSVQLPDGIKELGAGTFCLTGIEKIIIPGTVETVGKACFTTCVNLKTVIFEDGVSTLEENVFESCKNLERVYIPESVTTITGLNQFIDTNDNVVIYGSVGSEAERYAIENGIAFEVK